MSKDDNGVARLRAELRYRSMDQINDVGDSARTGRKMDAQQERRTIVQWTREDLEDKYLRLMEDYQTLKSHARQQETKITNLATKLKKVTDDIKRKENYPTNILLMKEDLENYKIKADMAENQNIILKGKIQLLQGQIGTDLKRPSAYDNVSSRINSGIAKRPNSGTEARRRSNLRMLKPSGESYSYTSMKNEQNLQPQNDQLAKMIEELHEDLRDKDRTIQQLSMKLQQDQYDPREKKSKVDENIELINLNKIMNDKKAQLEEMRARYADLEAKQRQLERTNYELIDEIERLQRGGGGSGRVAGGESPVVFRRRIQELEAAVNDHKKEMSVLKETNDRLTNSAFDAEREHGWREKEKRYRAQIAQLELTQRRDVGEKGSVLDRLGKERDMVDNMEKEISKLKVEKYELEIRMKEKDDKLRLLNKQGDASSNDIEEALILVQNRRGVQSTPDLQFLQKIDKETDKDLSRRFQDLEMNHAETIQELEKTRSLLQTQYKFTNNYKQESEKLSSRLEEIRKDYEERLNTYARLLDIRAARIHKLEAQMKDVTYGTKTPKIEEMENYEEIEPPIDVVLERGENLLEIHIGRVCLTQQATDKIGDNEPFLFATWDFYDFETQATGIIRGTSPQFDIKAEYLVKIDDFFLNYLYKNTFLFELHQAIGTEFVTLASCQMSCKEIMDRPSESGKLVSTSNGLKFNCKVKLVGTRQDMMDINVGVLEYWVRLKHPMDQVMRQYREKLKAEGYLMANDKSIMEAKFSSERSAENINELIIRVLRCNGINSRQKDVQPSSYLCYKFYDNIEQISTTITSSNNPEFHDLKRFPVQMDHELHQYLKSQSLKIYLIDELDPESSKYLGIANVPLLPLSNNKKITDSFELFDSSNKKNGSMDVEMEWMYAYMFSDQVLDREPVTMLPGEMEDLNSKTPVKEVQRSPKKKETKPVIKERKLKETKNEPEEQEVHEAPLSNQKSILKKKPRTNSPKRRLSETLREPDVVDLLQMVDTEDFAKVDSPRDSVQEDITLSHSIPKKEVIKDKTKDSLEILDQLAAKGDTPKQEKKSSKENSQGNIKKPQKTPRSMKMENQTLKPVTEEKDQESSTLDNDVVVVPKSSNKKKSKSKPELNPDEIMVEIISVDMEDNAAVLKDDNVNMLFAAYRIPGIHSEQTESTSLAKPKSNQQNKKMSFNFRKTFDVSYDHNYTIRQHIAVMLTEESKKDIVFNLVREPDDDKDEECEDIGVAKVNVRTILKSNKNLENAKIAIYSLSGDKELMGYMEVTVNMLGVLKAIEKELKND